MPTGSPLMPRVHLPSHCVSCGHTLPQTAGSEEVRWMTSYASSNFPSATSAIKAGMSTATGQPATQGLFLQCTQRLASSMAVASS